MGFEFLLMVLGISLLYNKTNIVQIFLHFLGCLFTTWFVLDNWRFGYMWGLWLPFGLLPFCLEVLVIIGVASFNKNLHNNSMGRFK